MSALVELVRNPWVIRICRIATGLILAAAGLAKIGDPEAFAQSVHNFRLVPIALENVIAVTLPWIEVVTALALILGIRARGAAWLAAAMLVVFTLGIVQAVLRDISITCGCFGKEGAATTGWLKVAENSGMILVALIACQRLRTALRP